jgi:sugar lactone lactonase YvrE
MSVEHIRSKHLRTGWFRLALAWLRPLRNPALVLLAPLALTTLACSGHGHHHADTAPAITAQPQSASVVSGRPVTFIVSATGSGDLTYQWAKNGQNILGAQSSSLTIYNPSVSDSGSYTVTITNTLGSIVSAPATLTVTTALAFQAPYGVVADAAGNLYVADGGSHVIWKVDATGHKTLLAGTPGVPGATDGPGASAQFRYPGGLGLDPAGNLLVADTGNDTIRRIATDGTVTTVAGIAGVPGSADGPGATATFNAPVGIVVDATGVAFIADSQNHVIRRMAADGTVSTLAGIKGQPGLQNGAAASALFNQPNGLALKADGTLVIADYGNSCIRTLSPAGQVATLAGQTTHGFADGSASTALFHWPVGVAVDASGVVWVADTSNQAIRKVQADGSVSTVAGSGGNAGNVDGTGTTALFNQPCGIAATPSGNLVIADTGNHLLRLLTPAGVVTTFTEP